jgi:hypothetical protein
MKAIICRLAALLALTLAPSLARAQCCWTPPPQAPDFRGPGYYYSNCYTAYGPMYYVRPPFPPYGGVIPGPCPQNNGMGGPLGAGVVPTHPWARSPRDFFMIDDVR